MKVLQLVVSKIRSLCLLALLAPDPAGVQMFKSLCVSRILKRKAVPTRLKRRRHIIGKIDGLANGCGWSAGEIARLLHRRREARRAQAVKERQRSQ